MLRVDYARWDQTPEDLRRLATTAAHPRMRERFLTLYKISQASCATRVAKRGERNPQTVMQFRQRINADPYQVADRLWVNDHLDPQEEKLRIPK